MREELDKRGRRRETDKPEAREGESDKGEEEKRAHLWETDPGDHLETRSCSSTFLLAALQMSP
jgi:hypothetical protein